MQSIDKLNITTAYYLTSTVFACANNLSFVGFKFFGRFSCYIPKLCCVVFCSAQAQMQLHRMQPVCNLSIAFRLRMSFFDSTNKRKKKNNRKYDLVCWQKLRFIRQFCQSNRHTYTHAPDSGKIFPLKKKNKKSKKGKRQSLSHSRVQLNVKYSAIYYASGT